MSKIRVVQNLHQGSAKFAPKPINEPISKDAEIDTGSSVRKRGKVNKNARVMQMKTGNVCLAVS